MTVNTPESALPPLYGAWMDELLPTPVASEPLASCDACPMLEPARPPLEVSFMAATKCCTVWPKLPNFLVGAILDDPDTHADGRRGLDERIAARSAITPLGVGVPKPRQEAYQELTMANEFGRKLEHRCPHYVEDSGGCGVWRHRNADCSTWYCRHQQGQLGSAFWRSLRRLLQAVEHELSSWCLLELELDNAALAVLFPRERRRNRKPLPTTMDALAADEVDAALYTRAWGQYEGREAELYRACAGLVEGMSWARVLDVCGPEVRVLARLLGDRQQALSTLPAWVRLGPHRATMVSPDRLRVRAYSSYHAYEMPAELSVVIRALSERAQPMKLEDAVAAASEARGEPLEDSLLRAMLESGLLVPTLP